jgi:hypothetical protein
VALAGDAVEVLAPVPALDVARLVLAPVLDVALPVLVPDPDAAPHLRALEREQVVAAAGQDAKELKTLRPLRFRQSLNLLESF